MKLELNSELEFQKDAINAEVDLFKGLPPKQSAFEVNLGTDKFMDSLQTELGIFNALPQDSNTMLLKNTHPIQERNNIPISCVLIEDVSIY